MAAKKRRKPATKRLTAAQRRLKKVQAANKRALKKARAALKRARGHSPVRRGKRGASKPKTTKKSTRRRRPKIGTKSYQRWLGSQTRKRQVKEAQRIRKKERAEIKKWAAEQRKLAKLGKGFIHAGVRR